MIKAFIVSDKNKKSQKIKKSIEKENNLSTLKKSNFIIVIGGDGFMLQTLKKFYKYKKPFYGINSGNYGFLMNKFSQKKIIRNLLKSKMISMAKSYDIDLKVTGVPSMPYFRIENEDQELHFKWVDNCLSKGIYMTSYHNHFLSAVHRESEIDLIVNLASKALEEVVEV